MVAIYLFNILHITVMYTKYIFSVMIISKPLNVNNNPWIHINMVILIYSKYTFVNRNISNYTF